MRAAHVLKTMAMLAIAAPVAAADAQRGNVLYETHCDGCHYERVHKRQKTNIQSLAALRLEVARWAAQTKRRFAPEEIDDIAAYLNQSHYRLGK